jgi:hypothetical protein
MVLRLSYFTDNSITFGSFKSIFRVRAFFPFFHMPFQLKDSLGYYHHLGLKEKLHFFGHELEQLDKKAF